MKDPLTVWTIGHSTHESAEFTLILQAHQIQTVADVRLLPGSRRYPQFNQEQLRETLAHEQIDYIHFPELGGRRRSRKDSPNNAWRNESFRGYADYMMTPAFAKGMERLVSLAREKRTTLLCAEVLWWRCHRSLISDWLKVRGVNVYHIMSSSKMEEHPFTSAARIVDGKLSYAAAESPLELRFD